MKIKAPNMCKNKIVNTMATAIAAIARKNNMLFLAPLAIRCKRRLHASD
jgi:hypothetical protein